MLGQSGEGAKEEIEAVLEKYGEIWDGRFGGEGGWEGLDVGPGKVDIEEEQESPETEDGWLEMED